MTLKQNHRSKPEKSFSDSESAEGETESDDDEEEEAPTKVEQGKKRPADSAIEKPGPDKKAKLVTPQMTGDFQDAKKGGGGHVATPHPAKQAGRTHGTQSKQQTPKSAGSHPCKSCNK
ncbi:hypothetical protein RHMOL_Rhmol04G0232400 [Rhododendron molle]|uniref:Uncharacterized protein n=1 Tax=Rhododendron molle TaxID=49168 RepID=A0ACC0P3A6_RHOML|nr:hypothetical protein RHMOL_Rhmol04G0232400 [Rhododendron molle]